MKLNIVLHKTSELDDWEEKIREAVEGKVEPLELNFTWVETCFDVLRGIDDSADINVVVLAPKKGMGSVVSPVIDRLLDKNARIFFGWYDDMPSMLEDFEAYLLRLLGVEARNKREDDIVVP